MNKLKCLKYFWLFLIVLSFILFILLYLVVGDRDFLSGHQTLLGKYLNAKQQVFLLIAPLVAMVNGLLFIVDRQVNNEKFLNRLKLFNKAAWLKTDENRKILVDRVRISIATLGSYIGFLVSTTLYMTIHYFTPTIPCPRHLLMILVWLVVTVITLFFIARQFKVPANDT